MLTPVAYHRGIEIPTRALAAIGRAATRALVWGARCHARHEQRRALRELDAEQLRDIGLTAADARAEAAKPWWRA